MKKLLALFLTAALLFSFIPAALAADLTVTIDGVAHTNTDPDSPWTDNGDGTYTYTATAPNSGTAVLDAVNATLTLKNLQLTSGTTSELILIGGGTEVEILLEGTNKVTSTNDDGVSIYTTTAATISGSGSLVVSGGYAGLCNDEPLVIDGVHVTATAQDRDGAAIYPFDDLTIQNGATIQVETATSCGIYSTSGGVEISIVDSTIIVESYADALGATSGISIVNSNVDLTVTGTGQCIWVPELRAANFLHLDGNISAVSAGSVAISGPAEGITLGDDCIIENGCEFKVVFAVQGTWSVDADGNPVSEVKIVKQSAVPAPAPGVNVPNIPAAYGPDDFIYIIDMGKDKADETVTPEASETPSMPTLGDLIPATGMVAPVFGLALACAALALAGKQKR